MNKGYQNFKKRAGQLAIALTLAGTTAIGANAATVTGVTKANVNMRSGAGTKYKVVSVVKADKTVTILGQKGSWYKVKYNGKTGYISKSYVIKKNYTVKKYSGKYKTKVALTVRKGPGTNYVKAGTLKKGTVVTVKGKTSNGWLQISYKGATRYISGSSKYVAKYTAPVKNNAPVIDVEDTYTLTKGEDFEYAMLKATATDKEDGDLTDKIDFSGVVNTGKVGEYTDKLTVKDSKGATATKSVKVVVKDKAGEENNGPAISVEGVTDDGILYITKGDVYSDSLLKAKAYDDKDGNITNKIKYQYTITKTGATVEKIDTSKIENYTVKLTVTDSDNNEATKTVKVVITNNVPPTITTSKDTYYVTRSTNTSEQFDYKILGAKATDKEDGDITNKIVYGGEIIYLTKNGEYEVKLTVEDSKGAKVTKTVKVVVQDNKQPEFVFKKDAKGNEIKSVEIKQYDTFSAQKLIDMLGITAKDEEDGDIAIDLNNVYVGNINPNVEGVQKARISIKDSHGLSNSVVIPVTVKANNKPVITFENISNNELTIGQGSKFDYKVLGAKATDKDAITGKDNPVIKALTYEGTVNVNVPGKYTVKVTAVDNDNSEIITSETITVTVEENSAPTISINDAKGTDWELKGNVLNVKLGTKIDTKTMLNSIKVSDPDGDTPKVEYIGFDKIDTNFTSSNNTCKIVATDKWGVATEQTIYVNVIQ